MIIANCALKSACIARCCANICSSSDWQSGWWCHCGFVVWLIMEDGEFQLWVSGNKVWLSFSSKLPNSERTLSQPLAWKVFMLILNRARKSWAEPQTQGKREKQTLLSPHIFKATGRSSLYFSCHIDKRDSWGSPCFSRARRENRIPGRSVSQHRGWTGWGPQSSPF